jgi:site-specific DNA-methyltransferase (adenine-specific)
MSVSQKISTSTQPLRTRLTTTHGLLFQDDCMNVLARIKSESVATVFADPPFNLGKKYNNGFEDSWSEKEYLEWSTNWIDECCRILKPGGAFFIYALPRLAYLFAAHLDDLLSFRHWIALSMKSTYPRGKKLYPAHYALLYFTKGVPSTFNKIRVPTPKCRHCKKETKDYGGYRNLINPEGISLTDFWDDTSPNRHRRSKARWGVNELKPIIPARAIQLSTDPRDVIFDPFGGGGSTYQEAQRLDRYWIGSEIGDCEPIERRFQDFAPTTIGRTPPQGLQDCLDE